MKIKYLFTVSVNSYGGSVFSNTKNVEYENVIVELNKKISELDFGHVRGYVGSKCRHEIRSKSDEMVIHNIINLTEL